MLDNFIVLVIFSVTIGSDLIHSKRLNLPIDEGTRWFDSLNVRFVGNWPFSAPMPVEYDEARELIYLGSGGGVYILSVKDPAYPVKLSEAIHARDFVESLFYESSNGRLYVTAMDAGIEIWNVTDPQHPTKLGSCDTPGWAYDICVSGS